MKRKLLLLAVALLCAVGSWADTSILSGEAGWSKITSFPATLSDYYFVFVDKNNDLMLFYNNGDHQGEEGEEYKTMWYTTSQNPIENQGMLWEISTNSDGWSIKSAVESTYYLQTEGNNAAWHCRTHDNGGGNASWYKWYIEYTDENELWKIENSTYANNYVGPWDAASFTNGSEVAGNKTASADIGHFYIYAIRRIDAKVLPAITYLESRTDKTADISSLRTKYSNGTYTNSTPTSTVYNDYKALEVSALSSADAADYTSALINPSFESGSMSGWTVLNQSNSVYPFYLSDCKVKSKNDEYPLTNIDGDNYMNYYGWSWSWNDGVNGIQQAIPNLPAGNYRVEAVLGGWTDWDMVLKVNDEEQTQTMTTNEAGVSFSVNVTLASRSDLTITAKSIHTGHNAWEACYIKADNFRIYNLDHYYDALNDAIAEAETHTLGFDNGEYAPYKNADALTALNAAKAVNQNNYDISWTELQSIVSALENATWTANVGEVDGVYNGNMAIANGNNPKGWTREDNAWGQQVVPSEGFDFSTTSNNTAWYYNISGKTSYYGNDGIYTMPLKASTTYVLKVKYCPQGGSDATLYATVSTGVTKVLNNHNLGAVSNKKFEEKVVKFTTTTAGNYILELKNQSNFYFTDVSILRAATSAEADALEAAIDAADAKTIGFEVGEYAPYNNISVLEALAAAKVLDTDVATSKEVIAATNSIADSEWTANAEELNAFYDGDFSECTADYTSPLDYTPTGWTASNNFRVMLKDMETYPGLAEASAHSAPMLWAAGITYGETTGYEMPLKANTVYRLSFKAAGWNTEDRSNITVSVLNSSDGLAATNLGTPDRDIKGNATNIAGMTSYETLFATGAAGNYVFHVECGDGRNFVFSDLELKKAAGTLSEDATSPILAGNYKSVALTRTLIAGIWNTFSVPFDFTVAGSPLEGARVMKFNSASDNIITVEDADEVVAGDPYLVKPASSNIVNPTFEAVEVENATPVAKGDGDYKFKAQLYNTALDTDGSVAYLSTDGSVKRLTSGGIKGLRAIFLVPTEGLAKAVVINHGDADGILSIDNGQLIMDNDVIYNLAGQKMSKLQRGVNIVNGKKVLVK